MVNWEHIRSKIPPPLRNRYILTILLFLVWITIFDENSVVNCVESKLEFRRMKHEKAYYEQQLKTTTDILQELSTNNDSLEKFARERYWFHNEDEEVFVVVE